MSRRRSVLLPVVGVAASLAAAVVTTDGPVRAATTRPVLQLSGSQLMQGLAFTWQAMLTTNPDAPVDISLGMTGGPAGRQAAIDGVNDAAITPTGFSADDLEVLADENKSRDDYLMVPIAAQALVWGELPPRQSLERPVVPNDINDFRTQRFDMPRATSFSSEFAIKSLFLNTFPYADDYIAAHGLAPHAYVPDAEGNDIGWRTTEPLDYVGVSTQNNFLRQPHRAGASTQAWMLERYTKQYHPDVWLNYTTAAAAGTSLRRDEPSEIPFWLLDAASTAGGSDPTAGSIIDQTMSVVLSAANSRLQTTNCCLFGGIPGWAAAKYSSFLIGNPDTVKFPPPPPGSTEAFIDMLRLKIVPIDGIAPTAANIAKALSDNVGLATPLPSGLPDDHGGYPLSYVNHLLVPTKDIGVAKANAMAAFIRWAVTEGQKPEVVSKTLDAPLPPVHVARALEQSNEIVKRNCATTRLQSDGSATVAGRTIELVTCGPPTQPAPTTTTTVAATTTTTAATTTTSTTVAVSTGTTPQVATGNAGGGGNVTTARPRSTTATTRPATATTTAPAGSPTTTAPAAPTTTTTTGKKAAPKTSAVQTQAVSAFVPEVDRAPRQRSYVLQTILGAVAFWLGTWLARRRQRWAVS